MKQKIERIFVTGGSGFIGTHLITRLVQLGYAVTNYDIRPPIQREHYPIWKFGDVLNYQSLTSELAIAKPQAIIHLAAQVDISSTNLDAFSSIHEGTKILLDALTSCADVKRFIHTSTQFVVGPGKLPNAVDDYNPYTTYGQAKAISEQVFRSRDPDCVWCIIRPTNIWGPFHPLFADTVWRYVAKGLYFHPVTRNPVLRSYGYVRNAVEQIIALLRAPDAAIHRNVFYLADEIIDSALWLDAFSQALRNKPVKRLPLPILKVGAKMGDGLRRLGINAPLDSSRLMRMTTNYLVPLDNTFELAGPPLVSLERGVEETVGWLRIAYPAVYA